MNGEAKLWQAVILQAIKDATGKNKFEKYQALKWLFESNVDFLLVCEFAGVLPSKVREKACKKLK